MRLAAVAIAHPVLSWTSWDVEPEPSAKPMWENYNATYEDVDRDELIRKFRKAMDSMKFRAPILADEFKMPPWS